jgi:hypothetical protein
MYSFLLSPWIFFTTVLWRRYKGCPEEAEVEEELVDE